MCGIIQCIQAGIPDEVNLRVQGLAEVVGGVAEVLRLAGSVRRPD